MRTSSWQSKGAVLAIILSTGAMLVHCGGDDSTGTATDGGSDGMTSDSGSPDTSLRDTATPDRITTDANATDTNTPDTNTPDTSAPDANTPDTGYPDTGTPDSGAPDANGTDTGTPDAGADAALDAGSDSGPQTVTVQVGPNGSITFSPALVTINVGDTVHWIWMGSGHTVTSGDPATGADNKFCSPNDMNCAAGVTSNAGFTYDHTFTQAGAYPYFCVPHALSGMVGTITVQ